MSRPGYSLGIGTRPQTLTICALVGAALTAFAAATAFVKLRIPQSGTIVGMTLNIGRGGTHVGSALVVKNNGNTVGTFDVDALTPGTPVDIEGSSLANVAMVKDNLISCDTTESGGTSPTWNNVVLTIDYVPTGD